METDGYEEKLDRNTNKKRNGKVNTKRKLMQIAFPCGIIHNHLYGRSNTIKVQLICVFHTTL